MITKEDFIELIEFRKKSEASINALYDAGIGLAELDPIEYGYRMEAIFLKHILTELQQEYLFHWMYECKFGEEYYEFTIDKNPLYLGTDIKMVYETLVGIK